MGRLRTLEIPVPPLAAQQEFLYVVSAIAQQRAASLQSTSQLDELFAALQHRAFTGQL